MSSKQQSPQPATQDHGQESPEHEDVVAEATTSTESMFDDMNESSSTRPVPIVTPSARGQVSTPPAAIGVSSSASSDIPTPTTAASDAAASDAAATVAGDAPAASSAPSASTPSAGVPSEDIISGDGATDGDANAASAVLASPPGASQVDEFPEPVAPTAPAGEDLNATVVLANRDPHAASASEGGDRRATVELEAVEAVEPATVEPKTGEDPTATASPEEVNVEWEIAEQPTLQFMPPIVTPRPAFLETGEQAVWPPRPTPQPSGPLTPPAMPVPGPVTPAPPRTLVTPQPGRPMPIPRPIQRPSPPHERLASPTGKRPLGDEVAAYSDPRMRRYVELRMQRGAHDEGKRGPTDALPVTQLVRQWWNDLLPGLQTALDHQHEARASGVYPIPAHAPTMTMRLGDAFGRLTATVRDITERAQSAAMPTLNKIHDRAEHAAQAIVDIVEGPPMRQQAPLLGPGRLAVFFRQGVTVGQAQRLLLIHEARPMRLIPRRHGFLAKVAPGQETEIAGKLNQHPYVRDVVYLEYDENGQPIKHR